MLAIGLQFVPTKFDRLATVGGPWGMESTGPHQVLVVVSELAIGWQSLPWGVRRKLIGQRGSGPSQGGFRHS